MTEKELQRMLVVEDFTTARLKVGDKFLFGEKIVGQQDSKEPGQSVSYYVVVEVHPNGNISYKMDWETLVSSKSEDDE